MLRIKVAAVSAIAAFALTGLAQAAPASAHEYKIEGKPVTTYTPVRALGEGVLFSITGTPDGVRATTQCSHVEMTGGLEAAGRSTLAIAASRCVVERPAECSIPEPWEISVKGTLLEDEGYLEDQFSAPEKVMTEWTWQGAHCSLKGKTMKLEGTQNCEFTSARGEEATEQGIVCRTTGSDLIMTGKVASMESSEIPLHIVNGHGEPTGQKWSAT